MFRSGLTFVELLMAATMFSILMVGFSAHLQGGVVAWRRVSQATERLQRVQVTLELLERDVANAFDFDPSGSIEPRIAFEQHRLAFFTVRPTQAGDPTTQAWFITYFLEGKQLKRAQQTLSEARAETLDVPARYPGVQAVVLEPLSSFSIHYGYQPSAPDQREVVWQSAWDAETNRLPRLIEVTLEIEEDSGSTGALRRIFVMPSGTLPPQPAGSP
jgi:type II secretory pathway component PulJ